MADTFRNIQIKDGYTQEYVTLEEEGLRGTITGVQAQACVLLGWEQVVLVHETSRVLVQDEASWLQNDDCLVAFRSEEDLLMLHTKQAKSSSNNNDELWASTLKVDVQRVCAILESHPPSSVDAIPKHPTSDKALQFIQRGCTPVMVALIYWERYPWAASCIVAALLDKGASVTNTRDDKGWTALHFGARYGDEHALQLLIPYARTLEPKNEAGKTPLQLLCARYDADPECLDLFFDKAVQPTTDLLNIACQYSNARVVYCILARLDKVEGKRVSLGTETFWACMGNSNQSELLLSQLKPRWFCDVWNSPKFTAMFKNGSTATAAKLAWYAPKSSLGGRMDLPSGLRDRPEGKCFMTFLLAGCVAGWKPPDRKINQWAREGPPNLLHPMLQLGCRVEGELKYNKEKRDLIQKDRDRRPHPEGDTELHAAVRTQDLAVVQEYCKKDWPNPFVANYQGLFPFQLATNTKIQEYLCTYMNTKVLWNSRVVSWYGPYFRSIAFTFFLVLQRLGQKDRINKDIKDKILHYVVRSLFPFDRLMIR